MPVFVFQKIHYGKTKKFIASGSVFQTVVVFHDENAARKVFQRETDPGFTRAVCVESEAICESDGSEKVSDRYIHASFRMLRSTYLEICGSDPAVFKKIARIATDQTTFGAWWGIGCRIFSPFQLHGIDIAERIRPGRGGKKEKLHQGICDRNWNTEALP